METSERAGAAADPYGATRRARPRTFLPTNDEPVGVPYALGGPSVPGGNQLPGGTGFVESTDG